mgnify:CR=1 FL=1
MATSTEGGAAGCEASGHTEKHTAAQRTGDAGTNGTGSRADGQVGEGACTTQRAHAGDAPAIGVAGCVDALRAWTGKRVVTLIYDSDVDEYAPDALFSRAAARHDVAVFTVTADGDVFGVFHAVPVAENEHPYADPALAIFVFESHGRCMTPQRFVVRRGMEANTFIVYWRNNPDGFLVEAGVRYEGLVSIGTEVSPTHIVEMGLAFEGLDSAALTGCAIGTYRCARVIAVHLSD